MTPSEVHAKLIALFPEFNAYWDSPHNCHRDEDGTFTLCGVFSQFSTFIREQVTHLQPVALAELGRFIEQCMESPPSSDLRNAAGACFLENVAGEEFTPVLAAHFGRRAIEVLSNYGPVA